MSKEYSDSALSPEESNSIYEAEVARELRRRRRLMIIYVVALVIPLVAAGLALAHDNSVRKESSSHLMSVVRHEISASLPRAIDSAFTPRLDSVITANVTNEVERQTSPRFEKFSRQIEADHRKVFQVFREMNLESVAASKSMLADSMVSEARYLHRLVANAEGVNFKLQSIERNVDKMLLVRLSQRVEELTERQDRLQHRLDSLSKTAFATARRDSLIQGVNAKLNTLTPRKLRKQGRAIKQKQRDVPLKNRDLPLRK